MKLGRGATLDTASFHGAAGLEFDQPTARLLPKLIPAPIFVRLIRHPPDNRLSKRHLAPFGLCHKADAGELPRRPVEAEHLLFIRTSAGCFFVIRACLPCL
jgi:hypothetical protein